jgi:MFS family permease
MTGSTDVRRQPLWYHGWNIVGVSVLSQVAALALTMNCFSLFLHDWTREFGVPVSALALSITLFSVGCMVTAPLAGLAASRYAARWVFGLALGGLAVAHVAVGFTTAAWQVVLIYALVLPFVIAFASAVQGQAVVSRWFVRRVGVAMGLTAFGAALAGVIFPSLIVWLLQIVGWREVWWIFAAAIGLLVTPLVVFVARDRPTEEEGRRYIGAGAAKRATSRLSLAQIMSRRNFWITIGVFIPVQCCFQSVSVNFAPLVTSYGLSPTGAGVMLSVMSAAALCAKLLSGLASDRFGNRPPLVGAALCVALGMGVIIMAPHHPALLVLGVLLVGCAGACWTLLASATVAEFGSGDFGRAYGLISAFTPVGSLAAPLLARVQEVGGSYRPGLAALALLALCGAGVALLLRESPRLAPVV